MKADFSLHNFKLIRYGGMSSSLREGPPTLRGMGALPLLQRGSEKQPTF